MARRAPSARGGEPANGRHDFDFLAGTWRVANRRRRNPAPDAPPAWDEFEARAESRPALGGLGNVDTFYVSDFPGRGPFHGLALRLFEPATGIWRIWWASTSNPGRLDPPLAGRFVGGEGRFEGADELAGRPVAVRFTWSGITPTRARWEQAFSFDGGETFAVNWTMEFSRVEAPPPDPGS